MPRTQTQFTDAILIRSVDYGEADRIVTLYTADLGKVSVMARGARRSKRRFAGSLEPYAIIRAEVAVGSAEVGRLAQAQIVRAFPGILRDLDKVLAAGRALELVRRATAPREPDARLYHAAAEVLELLDRSASGRIASEASLVAFEARAMAIVGFAPRLDACGVCGRRALEGQSALFDPERGSLVCRACGGATIKLGGTVRSRLLPALGRGWASVAGEPWTERELHQARVAIDAFVGARLG